MMSDVLTDLRWASIARQIEWAGGTQEPLPVLFKATELGGEAGEVINVVKKLGRERLGWTGSRATVEQLADELADLVICADLLAEPYGIDLAAAIVRKFNATSEQRGLVTLMRGSLAGATTSPDERNSVPATPGCEAVIQALEFANATPHVISRIRALFRGYAERVGLSPAPRWRHVARGSDYIEVGRAKVQNSLQLIDEGDTVVVYRGTEGQLWARHEDEFEDGRFVRVTEDDARG